MKEYSGIVTSTLVIAGLLLNGSTILLLVVKPNLRSPSNMLLASLTSSNCILCVLVLPVRLANITGSIKTMDGRGCDIFGFFSQLWWNSNSLTFMFISYDRYQFISKAILYKSLATSAKVYLFIGVTWLISVIFSLLPVFGWSCYKFIEDEQFCGVEWGKSRSFDITTQSISFIMPCLVSCYCYGQIIYNAQQSKQREMTWPSVQNIISIPQQRKLPETVWPSVQSIQNKKLIACKPIKTSIIIIIMFLIIYLPYIIVRQFHELINNKIAVKITANLLFFSVVVFPYLFVYRNRLLRKEMQKLFKRVLNRDVRQIHPSVDINENDYLENVSRRNSRSESIENNRRCSTDHSLSSIQINRKSSEDTSRRCSLEMSRRWSSNIIFGTNRRESGKSEMTTVDS
nr:rhodopsin [Hydra vulgaris]